MNIPSIVGVGIDVKDLLSLRSEDTADVLIGAV
jgi:hypothetical protein